MLDIANDNAYFTFEIHPSRRLKGLYYPDNIRVSVWLCIVFRDMATGGTDILISGCARSFLLMAPYSSTLVSDINMS